jgi:hypothetical protein
MLRIGLGWLGRTRGKARYKEVDTEGLMECVYSMICRRIRTYILLA